MAGKNPLLLLVAACLFCSCSSLTPERVDILAQIAGQAAQFGTQQWLKDHPDHRDAFALVLAELQRLLKAGETNQAQYATNLNGLPTATLAGPSGAVYVTEDRLVVWDAELKKAVTVKGAAEQPVIRATVSGLKRAMLPLPPVPGKARPVPVWRSAVSFTGQHPVLSHDGTTYRTNQPGLTTPEPLPLSRTNVTRSGVEVTPHVGNWSHVTVSWQMGPRSVYHIENQVGTNWHCLGSITNISGTGPTNWVTKWPAFVPVGQWRVLRVR